MIAKLKQKIANRPKPDRETVLELLCWVFSCWLISVGICLIADSHLAFQIGIRPILWQTLLAVTISFLLSRRWWIAVIYFGILVPVFFLAISISGDIYGFFGSIASFFGWWADGMPYGSRWYSDQGFYMVHTFINVGISLLFFVVARITKRAWTLLLLIFLFVIQNYIKGFTGYNILAVPFLLVGIFPLLAGQRFQRIKPVAAKNHFGVKGKKWLFITVSTLSAIAVLATSFAVANTTDQTIRTRFSSDIVADVQTATNTFTKDQQKVNIALHDLGLVTNSNYIGGNLYDIEPEVIATTNLKKTTLFKVTAFDTFDGKIWTTDFKKGYRINGIWEEEQSTYLNSRLLGDNAFNTVLNGIVNHKSVTVKMKQDANFLLTTGQVINFKEITQTENPILFDELGRLVSYYGQKKGYSYSFDAVSYNTTAKVVRTQVSSLLKEYANKKDPFYKENSAFYKLYTKPLPDAPKKVKSVVKSLKLENKNPYEKAYKICNYFLKEHGFEYTDTPPTFTKENNIIKELFKNKKGHCLYYSTAMIALAREAGVPSRLAAGYRTIDAKDGKTQVIDKSAPFAWVECYIPNLGWINFDPSPLKNGSPIKNNKPSNEWGNAPDVDVEEGEVDDVRPPKKEEPEEIDIGKIISISVFVSLGVLVLLLVLNTLFSHKLYELDAVRKRLKSTKQQAEFYYKDILRQYSWLGFRFKTGETITELTLRVCDGVKLIDKDVACGTIKIIEALHYANKAPIDEDIEAIFKLRKLLERALKRNNNGFMYVIKRRLFLPPFEFGCKKYK